MLGLRQVVDKYLVQDRKHGKGIRDSSVHVYDDRFDDLQGVSKRDPSVIRQEIL